MQANHVVEGLSIVLHGDLGRRTYRRCEIIIDGSPFSLDGCLFEDCKIAFVGPAAATLASVQAICSMSPDFAATIGRQLGIIVEQLH